MIQKMNIITKMLVMTKKMTKTMTTTTTMMTKIMMTTMMMMYLFQIDEGLFDDDEDVDDWSKDNFCMRLLCEHEEVTTIYLFCRSYSVA